MRDRILLAISTLCTLALSTPALAVISLPVGWYVDSGIGYSDVSQKSARDTGVGVTADAGYKFNPYLGGEVGFNAYQNTYIRLPNGKKVATISLFNFDVAGKGIVPFGLTGFELYAKLGLNRSSNQISINNQKQARVMGIKNSTTNSSGLYFGTGAQFNLTPSIAGTVQWMRALAKGGSTRMDLYSVGISYIPGW